MSLPCSWNQAFSTKVNKNKYIKCLQHTQFEPAEVAKIDFVKPSHSKTDAVHVQCKIIIIPIPVEK